MSWKVRHQGSPQHAEVASTEEIGQGIQDGAWEPTDEVMGPGEGVAVPEADLEAAIEKAMQKTGYSRLAMEVDRAVPWRVVMAIQDAAAGAKIQETIRIVRRPRTEVEESR